MKKLFAVALLVLSGVSAGYAQETATIVSNSKDNAAPDFKATSAAKVTLFDPLTAADSFAPLPVNLSSAPEPTVPATTSAVPLDSADPAAPAAKPKFLYGGRDDYRWQLGLGISWIRFRSSIFNASAVGTNTSVTYFLNDWFAVEGTVSTGFAPQIFDREHVKLVFYGGGAKIAWRQRRWEPWLHGIVGGMHEQPQTSQGAKNSLGIQVGGGADYRINPRFSGRLEADYLRSQFFNQSQNNFQLAASVVVHF
jgi:opacity protein-like surface antigen